MSAEDFRLSVPGCGPRRMVITYAGLSGSTVPPYHSSSNTSPCFSQRQCNWYPDGTTSFIVWPASCAYGPHAASSATDDVVGAAVEAGVVCAARCVGRVTSSAQ